MSRFVLTAHAHGRRYLHMSRRERNIWACARRKRICSTRVKGPHKNSYLFMGGLYLAKIGTHYRGKLGLHVGTFRIDSDPLKTKKFDNDTLDFLNVLGMPRTLSSQAKMAESAILNLASVWPQVSKKSFRM